MEKLRIGMVGCGVIATEKHMPTALATGLAEITAFCDGNMERAKKASEKFGVRSAKVFTDYTELIKEDLDAVYVCTPNRSHSEIAVAALESGRHVMCEKPMAINYAEAHKMCEAAKNSGKLLTIGYQNRFRPDSQFLKRECEAGELGEIYYAKAKAVRRRGVPTWGVFLNKYEQGGGPLIDIGTHALDLTLWMMDNYAVKSVVGTVYNKLNCTEKFTVEDSAFGFIVMENGATINLEASWALNTLDVDEAKTVLCGTKAGADMNNGLEINGVKNNRLYTLRPSLESGEVAFFSGDEDTPEIKEQRVFLNAIMGKGSLVVLPEQAAAVTRILDAIYLSAKEGKQIVF